MGVDGPSAGLRAHHNRGFLHSGSGPTWLSDKAGCGLQNCALGPYRSPQIWLSVLRSNGRLPARRLRMCGILSAQREDALATPSGARTARNWKSHVAAVADPASLPRSGSLASGRAPPALLPPALGTDSARGCHGLKIFGLNYRTCHNCGGLRWRDTQDCSSFTLGTLKGNDKCLRAAS